MTEVGITQTGGLLALAGSLINGMSSLECQQYVT